MRLTEKQQNNRNKLKEKKPLVYEKVIKFDEKIKKGESISILHLQYDYKCNFNCTHCSIKRLQRKRKIRSITPKDLENISKQADDMGLARWVITGGEPLVFPDLDKIIKAINPEKFWINCDTNGWLLTKEKAKYLKNLGIDRIQLSLDSYYVEEHDSFRNKKGSYKKAIAAIDNAKNVGLDIFINTVATKQRLHSEEFIKFLEFLNFEKETSVYVSFAKPVGAWENNLEILIDNSDIEFVKLLEKKYNVFTHLTKAYGIEMGCPAGKNITSIMKTGDVLPCQYFQVSLGNVFEEDLKTILDRCMRLKVFQKNTCLMAEDRDFINKYLINGVYKAKELPITYKELFSEKDFD